MDQVQEHKDVAAPAQLPAVQRVVTALLKVLGGKRLYSENNPRLEQFGREFRAVLGEYFEGEPELTLTVQQYDLLWRGEPVYHNDKRDESVAFMLYKDGVGEITLHERALDGEIDTFLQIIADESAVATQGDEDVVTRLWSADFDHISYRVIDDYLASDLDAADDGGGEVDVADQPEIRPSLEDRGRKIVRATDPPEAADRYLERVLMKGCDTTDPSAREAHFQDQLEIFFESSAEERVLYHAEREREVRDDGLAAFAETILVFTLLQDNPSAVRDIIGVMEQIVDHVVTRREPGTLSRLIELVRGFRESHELPENIAETCGRIEAKLTDPALVRSFEEDLEHWSPDTEHVLSYFRCIGPSVVDPLIKILHRVEGGRLHREICNVLLITAGDDIHSALDRLDIDNPNVARDAVYMAGQIDVPSVTPRIQELLCYPDRRVKGDMLEIVAGIDDPAVPDLIMEAVTDADKEIRCKAMQVAATRRLPQVARHLDELAFGKEIEEKDPDERDAVFKALGMVGDTVTVEQLRKFVEKRRLLDFSGNRDRKLLAMRALEFIQEPASEELLDELSRDSNDTVKTRAARALNALRSRMRTDRAQGTGRAQ